MIAEYIRKRDTKAVRMTVFLTAAEILGIYTGAHGNSDAASIAMPCLQLLGWLCVPVSLYYYFAACNSYAQAKGYDDGYWLLNGFTSLVIYIASLAALHNYTLSGDSQPYFITILQSYLGVMILLLNGLLLKLLPDRSAGQPL